MTELVTGSTVEQYESFVSSHVKGHFMQSSLWAKQKPGWRWVGLVSRDNDGHIRGTLGLLIRKLPGLPWSMMYGCRGPVCGLDDEAIVRELLLDALRLAKRERCYLLKIDPDITEDATAFIAAFDAVGFKFGKQGKDFEGIQPRFVYRKNISGMSEDEAMASFSQKTRYNIRVAERSGVTVRVCNSEAELDDFSRLMEETGRRDGFVTRNRSYFASLLDNMDGHVRLYMAYWQDKPLAGAIAIHYGNKVWYLYGASTSEHRNVMPNYLLQWNMIRWAISENCAVYDFRGISGDLDPSSPLYGLYRFKKGFNGDFTEFVGEMDYNLIPAAAITAGIMEKAYGAYKTLLAKLRKPIMLPQHRIEITAEAVNGGELSHE